VAEQQGSNGRRGGLMDGKGGEQLSEEFQHLISALGDRVLSGANNKVGGLTERLTDMVENPGARAAAKAAKTTASGGSPLKAGLSAAGEGIKSKVGNLFKGGGKDGKGGKGGKKLKLTNIIEEIDVGVPIKVAYNQWTQFQDFSGFMKKVEGADQKEDQKLAFKAQVFWSHRSWEATIVEQVPDSHIIWRSSGEKGRVDGAVTFHELAPELTRIIVVLEYYPQGLFERTGNLWRAQGRRARLELKHYARHVMTQTLLHPDELEGWRGEIHDSKVTKSHEDALAEEQDEDQEGEESEEPRDEADDEGAEDEDEGAEDEGDEDEGDEDELEDEADEDYEDEGAEDEDEGAEDEADEDELEDEADEDYEDEGAEDEDEGDELQDEDEDEGAEDELEDEDAEDTDEEDEEDEDEDERPRRRAGGRPQRRRPARAGRR
jgi:hypothetical protein